MIIKTFFSIFMLILISLYKERNQASVPRHKSKLSDSPRHCIYLGVSPEGVQFRCSHLLGSGQQGGGFLDERGHGREER